MTSADTIAVTGATGQVGSATVRTLRARGARVRRLLGSGASSSGDDVFFDFLQPATFAPALAGCSSLFLLRPPAIGDVKTHLFPVIDAAVAAGVKRIVFLSVTGAEHRAYLPHAKVEAHLRTLPTSVVVALLRPGFFAQNLLTAYREDIAFDDRIYVCAGRGKVAFVDANDLGEVAAAALHAGVLDGRAVTLTGAVALDFDEVAAILSDVLGRTIHYDAASIAGFCLQRLTRRHAKLLEAVIITALHAGLRRGDAAAVDPALGELLGRAPTSLRAVIERDTTPFSR